MLASVFSRSSASQSAGGKPAAHVPGLGNKLDGLPLTAKVSEFMSDRLANPM